MRTFREFWTEAFALRGSITPKVMPHVIGLGALAAVVCVAEGYFEQRSQIRLALAISPHEIIGTVLGLLLVLRTNAGHERWWEARKLWGGITNQCRNLVITALAYGPDKPEWRHQFVGWTAAFAYVARTSLRGDRICSELPGLIGLEAASELARVNHKPSFVTLKLASLLMEACEKHGMDRFAFLQADKERAQLIDHIGGCERILKTPLPLVFAIKIRRYIALFLLTLPFVLLNKMPDDWLIPFVTMLVAYPLLSLDQISVELQNPFSKANLSHLPLDGLAVNIERNLRGLLANTR